MSERGSIVTEYIYCDTCKIAVWDWIYSQSDYEYATAILGGSIIVAKTHGGYPREMINSFDPTELAKNICHTIRLAILDEKGQAIVFVRPNGSAYSIVELPT